MTDCFLTILDMSLSASWLVLAIIAARFLLKKAPRWLTCSLWALVALRLICPFSFESAVSLIPEFSIPPTTVEETLPERVQDLIWDTSSSPGDKMSVAIPDNEGIPVVYEVYLSEDGTTKPVAPPARFLLPGPASPPPFGSQAYLRCFSMPLSVTCAFGKKYRHPSILATRFFCATTSRLHLFLEFCVPKFICRLKWIRVMPPMFLPTSVPI